VFDRNWRNVNWSGMFSFLFLFNWKGAFQRNVAGLRNTPKRSLFQKIIL
jgi:hypothetical protein